MIKLIQLLALLLFITVTVAFSLGAGRVQGYYDLSPERLRPAPFSAVSQDSPSRPEKTAEQVYKNIQVFKGLPASQLDADMAFITGSLGVRCNYCHINPFEKDDKPTKQTARQMVRMVFALNNGSFNGQAAVSCYTCHRGQPRPQSVPSVGQNLWQSSNQAVKQDAPLPSLDEILAWYVQAVGGRRG